MATLKVALDAGHYLHTPGKRCLKSLDPNETREWVLNNRVARLVEELLAGYEDVETLRVDDPDGKLDVTLATRVQRANKWGADIYISIHHNAGINGGSGGGIVVYCCPDASKTSVELRDKLYEALIRHTGLKGNRADGTAEANLYVTKHTTMPANLLELGFMDSSTDVPIILTDAFAESCANAIVEVIVQQEGLKKKGDTMTQEQFDQMLLDWLRRQGDKPISGWSRMDEASAAGITDGTRPQSFATREEVATMIVNAMQAIGG